MFSNALADAARQAWRILLWQILWVAALALLGVLAAGAQAGWSLLAGGCIGCIGTMHMALTMQRHSVDHGRRLSPARLFGGWLLKLVLTTSLLAIAFRSQTMAPLPLLLGLGGALVAYWSRLSFGRVRYADSVNGK